MEDHGRPHSPQNLKKGFLQRRCKDRRIKKAWFVFWRGKTRRRWKRRKRRRRRRRRKKEEEKGGGGKGEGERGEVYGFCGWLVALSLPFLLEWEGTGINLLLVSLTLDVERMERSTEPEREKAFRGLNAFSFSSS